jgi:tRNA-dihydrouridine synthase B
MGCDKLLQIGRHTTSNRVVLAPMAGVTDKPFRDLCKQLGAGFMVSEMISSDSRLWASRKSRQRLEFGHEDYPKWIQIAGSDPLMLGQAARHIEQTGGQIVDINMGCPAKKVCRKAAGSALLKDIKLVEQILRSVVDAVDIPVTLKMRTGWSPTEKNALSVAHIAEDCGIAAISIHGRTRACHFSGEAEFDTIAEIKASVSVPVIANGDIDSPEKARRVMEYTGADGVMIGRAALGKPWVIGDIDQYLKTGIIRKPPSCASIGQLLLTHLDTLHRFYGEISGVRIARKHLGWYLSNTVGGDEFRRKFNGLNLAADQMEAIRLYFGSLDSEQLRNVEKEIAA